MQLGAQLDRACTLGSELEADPPATGFRVRLRHRIADFAVVGGHLGAQLGVTGDAPVNR
jgi:hypothetical protein